MSGMYMYIPVSTCFLLTAVIPCEIDFCFHSVWHVYYEQYLTVVHSTWVNLTICLASVFGVTFLLLGLDIWSAFVTVLTIALIINSMFGLMYLWGISLNAVSLVNLVMVRKEGAESAEKGGE